MTDLRHHLSRLTTWLQGLDGCPALNDVLILDTSRDDVRYAKTGDGWRWSASREALTRPERYSARFDMLLARGYSWINLSAYGLLERSLIVAVELPGESGKVPMGMTAINLSGPDTKTKARGWQFELLLED